MTATPKNTLQCSSSVYPNLLGAIAKKAAVVSQQPPFSEYEAGLKRVQKHALAVYKPTVYNPIASHTVLKLGHVGLLLRHIHVLGHDTAELVAVNRFLLNQQIH